MRSRPLSSVLAALFRISASYADNGYLPHFSKPDPHTGIQSDGRFHQYAFHRYVQTAEAVDVLPAVQNRFSLPAYTEKPARSNEQNPRNR